MAILGERDAGGVWLWTTEPFTYVKIQNILWASKSGTCSYHIHLLQQSFLSGTSVCQKPSSFNRLSCIILHSLVLNHESVTADDSKTQNTL